MARKARRPEGSEDDILTLVPPLEVVSGMSTTTNGAEYVHMRSLGFMGSYLLQYASAQVGHRALPGQPQRCGREGKAAVLRG